MIGVRELRLALSDGTEVAASLHVPVGRPGPEGRHRRAPDASISDPVEASREGTERLPVLLLPGARGDHGAEHLVALAELLAGDGHVVLRSSLVAHAPGSGVVGPAERNIGRLLLVLDAARSLLGGAAWVIGGASYGGRVASLAVARHGASALGVVGLLLVAYPLHPPGRPERLRVAHWPDIDAPTFLLAGDADPFLTPGLLEEHAGAFGAPLTHVSIAGGRHDLSVSARRAPDGRSRTSAEAVATHAGALKAWLATLPGEVGSGQ